MTLNEFARVLVRAADIAEQELSELQAEAALGYDGYSQELHAAYRQLRWLADGAVETVETATPTPEPAKETR